MCMTFPRGLGPAFLTLSGLELKYSRMNWMDAGGYYIPSLFPYHIPGYHFCSDDDKPYRRTDVRTVCV